jgi:hypothetical protein
LIIPLPKFPTRRSPANDPKLDGAICRPHGESSAPRDQALFQRAVQIEYIDKSVSSSGFVVVLGGVLLGVSNIEFAVDDLIVERGVPL